MKKSSENGVFPFFFKLFIASIMVFIFYISENELSFNEAFDVCGTIILIVLILLAILILFIVLNTRKDRKIEEYLDSYMVHRKTVSAYHIGEKFNRNYVSATNSILEWTDKREITGQFNDESKCFTISDVVRESPKRRRASKIKFPPLPFCPNCGKRIILIGKKKKKKPYCGNCKKHI